MDLETRLRGLMIQSLSGDEQSYRQLLTDLRDRLRRYYARRLGAGHAIIEDLVQETLLAVHMRRHTYDSGRPFTAWIHAIARYKLADHWRTASKDAETSAEAFGDEPASDPSDLLAARIDVDHMLEGLPAGPRGFIRAVKIDGRSVAEVSAQSGVSESAVKVAIHRGLKRLVRRIKESHQP